MNAQTNLYKGHTVLAEFSYDVSPVERGYTGATLYVDLSDNTNLWGTHPAPLAAIAEPRLSSAAATTPWNMEIMPTTVPSRPSSGEIVATAPSAPVLRFIR